MAGGTKPVPHTRKAENFQEGAKKSRSKTDKQNSGAGNKGFAVATSSVAAITFIRSKKLRCHRKNTPIQTASAGPVLVMETQSSRQNPSPTQSEKSHIQSENGGNGNEPSERVIPILTSRATEQTFDRIRPDRAIIAQYKARSRPGRIPYMND